MCSHTKTFIITRSLHCGDSPQKHEGKTPKAKSRLFLSTKRHALAGQTDRERRRTTQNSIAVKRALGSLQTLQAAPPPSKQCVQATNTNSQKIGLGPYRKVYSNCYCYTIALRIVIAVRGGVQNKCKTNSCPHPTVIFLAF